MLEFSRVGSLVVYPKYGEIFLVRIPSIASPLQVLHG